MEQFSIPGLPDAAESEPKRVRLPRSPRKGLELSEYTWAITPHVCRICFGRVLARETFDRRKVYRCSNCGVEREGQDERAICACGIKMKNNKDAGIRCCKNEARSPEWPGEIVALQADLENKI